LSADLGFTTILYIFFHQLPSEVTKQNLIKTGHMLGSKCDFKTSSSAMAETVRAPSTLLRGGSM